MLFYVNSNYKHNTPSCINPLYPCVVLAYDTWDDYTFRTTFHMTLFINAKEKFDFGFIKIFSLEERFTYTALTKNGNLFKALNKDYCSLGQDIGYYEKLRGLSCRLGEQILIALRDIAYCEDIRNEFLHFDGVRKSLLRNIGANTALKNGRAVFLMSFKQWTAWTLRTQRCCQARPMNIGYMYISKKIHLFQFA